MTTTQNNQRLIAIAIVVIIALLGLNGYLWYAKTTQDKLIKKQNKELIDTENAIAEAEKAYFEAMSELDEMKTANRELNSMIETQKNELRAQKARISELIISERDLKAAREEIGKLRTMTQKYVAEIAQLRQENEALSAANVELSETNQALSTDIEQQRQVNEELQSSQAALVSQNERLAMERENLAEKVTKASVVLSDNIEVRGYRIKNNGKESFSRKAAKIEGLKICFNTLDNTIAPKGVEKFFVRIVDPTGTTLSVNELGSGEITDRATDKQLRYTQYREMDYEQVPTTVCMNWQPGTEFMPGQYKVEVYNKGYLSGVSDFELK